MLSIKLDYDALVSLLKPVPSWFHLLASAFDPLTTFFFGAFLCISSICLREAFYPVECINRKVYFATAFHCCLLIPHSVTNNHCLNVVLHR